MDFSGVFIFNFAVFRLDNCENTRKQLILHGNNNKITYTQQNTRQVQKHNKREQSSVSF